MISRQYPQPMPVAFVCGPYRSPDGFAGIAVNIETAREIAKALWQQGYTALCPHLNTAHFDGIAPDHVFLDGALELMRRSDLVVLAPRWHESSGSMAEIREAVRMRKPIYEWPRMQEILSNEHFNIELP